MVKRMFEDTRKIKCITLPGESGGEFRVGSLNIEKIEVYQEFGDMAAVTWFAIYVGGEIKYRVNAAHVDVVVYFLGVETHE